MSAELIDICRGPMPHHGGARLVGGRTRVSTDYSEFDTVPNANRKDKVKRVSILSKDKLQIIDEDVINKPSVKRLLTMNRIFLFFERKGTIVILSFVALMSIAIALLVIAIAIWNHQRYVPLHPRAYIDSRTGECYHSDGSQYNE